MLREVVDLGHSVVIFHSSHGGQSVDLVSMTLLVPSVLEEGEPFAQEARIGRTDMELLYNALNERLPHVDS